MKRLILVVILLQAFCSISYPATYYVDKSGNDGNGGTSWSDAWLTINYAIDNVDDGDTVDVNDGTYNEGNNGLYPTKATQDGETITIHGESAAGTILTGNNYGILVFTDWDGTETGHKLIFQNMTIQSQTDTYVSIGHKGYKVDLEFQDCIIKAPVGGTGQMTVVADTATDANATREIIFTDCTINPGTTGGAFFKNTDSTQVSKLEVTGCTISGGCGSTILLQGTCLTFDFHNNTITGATGTNTNDLIDGDTIDACTIFLCYNNTATNLRNAIKIPTAGKIYIADSTFTINQNSGVVWGICVGSNNTPDESTTTIDSLLDDVIVTGNTLTYTGSDNGHGILIGGDTSGATCTYNTIKGGDFQIVVKGVAAHVAYNIAIGAQTLYLCGGQGCYIHNNTCYSNSTYAFSWSDNTGYGTARSPTHNVIENNIFVATSGANNCVSDLGVGNLYGQHLNYNCYYGGDTNVFTFNGTGYDTIAALVAAESWDDSAGNDNDSNTVVANPLFADASSGDFRLKHDSPCLNAGKPTLANGYTSMGVWQGIARSVLLPDNCVEWLEVDLNYDCKVDFQDFAIFAQDWLECTLEP